jgi:hypothetical protein
MKKLTLILALILTLTCCSTKPNEPKKTNPAMSLPPLSLEYGVYSHPTPAKTSVNIYKVEPIRSYHLYLIQGKYILKVTFISGSIITIEETTSAIAVISTDTLLGSPSDYLKTDVIKTDLNNSTMTEIYNTPQH